MGLNIKCVVCVMILAATLNPNGVNTPLLFEPQHDSSDSILYDFQTAEQPKRFIYMY